MPVRAAGAAPGPGAVELQSERDVGLDADDRRTAVDHVVLQAGPDPWTRAGHRRALPRGSGAALAPQAAVALLDELLPRARPLPEVARSAGARLLAPAGDPGGA